MHGYFFKKSTSCRFWWLMKQIIVIRFIKGVFCHCHPYGCYFHNIIYLFPNRIVVAHDVGNKAKGQISKRVFQENKPRHVTTTWCEHVRIKCARNVCFSENLACFVSWKTHFEIRRFGLLPTMSNMKIRLDNGFLNGNRTLIRSKNKTVQKGCSEIFRGLPKKTSTTECIFHKAANLKSSTLQKWHSVANFFLET